MSTQQPTTEPLLQLTVNGETHAVTAGSTVADLLATLGIARETVAVERNRAIVRRADHGQTPLAAGDQIEIVQFVGGGC